MTDDAPREAADHAAESFVLDLGHALHALGHPSHWLEDGMSRAAERLGLVANFFTTPTSIFAAFGTPPHQRTHLLRVEPGAVHLERLARTIAVGHDVLAGRLLPAAGSAELRAIMTSRPRYGRLVTMLAFALSGAAAGRFLGGGLHEVLAASALGAAVALLGFAAERVPESRRMFEPIAVFLVSLTAAALAHHWMLSVYVTTLGAILVLLPGLTLTAAMAELSSQHLVSGTSRLSGAAVQFLGLAFGVVMGTRIASGLWGAPPHVTPWPLPGWTEYVALFGAPLAFTVLLRARPRDYVWIQLVGVLTFFAGRFATKAFGSEPGVLTGALVAAAASNLIARRRGTSPATTLIPAILLLVPGSVGFRSLTMLMNRDVLSGVEAAFRTISMVGALVAGLLTAGVFVPAPALGEHERRR
ncbi:MAG: threonine/serine exporter family protein [Candidatus Eisenbacteria bacterium]